MPSWSGGCSRRRRSTRRRPAAAGLDPCPRGAEAARRDAAAAVGGVPGRARRRLRLQPVLRSLPGLAPDHLGDDAPDARAGEKLFVDYAGDTVPVFDATTGKERRAQIFVAVLGASNYTYAEARWTEGLADWIGAHVNALERDRRRAEGGRLRQPQGRRHRACRYEPGINRTYQELAAHYGTAILPTRPRKPRDKAKVEVAVLIVERLVLAQAAQPALLLARRAQCGDPRVLSPTSTPGSCASSASAARAVRDDRPAGAQGRCRRALSVRRVEEVSGRARLSRRGRRSLLLGAVAPDPRAVEARITDTTVEVLHKGVRVASHARSHVRHRHTTIPEHMPSAHRRYADWTPAG